MEPSAHRIAPALTRRFASLTDERRLLRRGFLVSGAMDEEHCRGDQADFTGPHTVADVFPPS